MMKLLFATCIVGVAFGAASVLAVKPIDEADEIVSNPSSSSSSSSPSSSKSCKTEQKATGPYCVCKDASGKETSKKGGACYKSPAWTAIKRRIPGLLAAAGAFEKGAGHARLSDNGMSPVDAALSAFHKPRHLTSSPRGAPEIDGNIFWPEGAVRDAFDFSVRSAMMPKPFDICESYVNASPGPPHDRRARSRPCFMFVCSFCRSACLPPPAHYSIQPSPPPRPMSLTPHRFPALYLPISPPPIR